MNKLIVLKAIRKIMIPAVLFIVLSAHFLFSPLFGHPVWGEKIILTQPNGMRIVGYIYGDEFHRRIETEQEYTMILNEETGTIEYAVLENNKLVPSGLVVGVVKPFYLEQINLPKHLSDRKLKIAEIRRKSPERLHDRLQPRPETKGVKILALEGTKKVFAVCVQFQPETSPPTGWDTGQYSPGGFDTRLFSTGATDLSMTNYYKSNSYTKFQPEGYTYSSWITLPQTATWYKNNDSWKQVIIDAMDGIRTIEPTFDFTQYATAGDMDMILVWAGTYENWNDFFWPQMSQANVIRYGVRVKYYNAVNEKNTGGSENIDISVFCHEYGHMTGCPDLYDYSSFQLKPVGTYCIMGTSNRRINFCGFLKWRNYGWVTPVDIFSGGTHSTDALGLASVTNPRLHKIDIDSPAEYLLFENRFNTSDANYENLTGRRDGLLITHVDENYSFNDGFPAETFYGIEAIVPVLDPTITTLGEYAAYYNEMVFSDDASYNHNRLEPAYPDDKGPGEFLTLTTGDDTEHVIYRNTQSHTSSISTGISISDISVSGSTMSFTVTMPSTTPAISGTVKNPAGQGIAGVTMTFSGGGGSTTTDTDGNYSQSVSSGWSGTATPSNAGSIFEPSSRSYTNVTNSQVEQDYVGAISFIKGNVTNGVAGIEDVWVAIYSSAGSYITYDATDINGDYVIGGLSTASYRLHFDTRYASGMQAAEWYDDKDSFSTSDLVPVTEGITTSGIDAVLAAGGGIAGRVTNSAGGGIQSVIVNAYTPTGGFISNDITDSNGDYEIISVKSGSYKVYYSAAGAPGDYISEYYNDQDSLGTADSVSVAAGEITSGIDAVLAAITPKISGAVKDSADTGIQDVTITFSNSGGTATTDSSGGYFHSVPDGWSGTATPTKTGYTFSPTSINYTNVTSDQTDHNYTATIIQRELTIVAESGGTTDPVPGTYQHNHGTQVPLTAEPGDGQQFDGWTGDVPSGHENDISVTITMDADKSITATFSAIGSGDEDGNGGGEKKACFIATAAYGSQLHPHLDILRDFRDKYLMPNGFGRKLVELYYRYSPGVADFIAKHKLLKVAVRINLLPLVVFSSFMVNFGPVATAVVLVFMLGISVFLIWFYPRRVRVL